MKKSEQEDQKNASETKKNKKTRKNCEYWKREEIPEFTMKEVHKQVIAMEDIKTCDDVTKEMIDRSSTK